MMIKEETEAQFLRIEMPIKWVATIKSAPPLLSYIFLR